jgi:hypothetical protein
MKVKVLDSVAGVLSGRRFACGKGEQDVPPAVGQYLIDKGLAEKVEAPKAKPVRVTKVKAETRPIKKKVE